MCLKHTHMYTNFWSQKKLLGPKGIPKNPVMKTYSRLDYRRLVLLLGAAGEDCAILVRVHSFLPRQEMVICHCLK